MDIKDGQKGFHGVSEQAYIFYLALNFIKLNLKI